MGIYVGWLRGVNVGGKNTVEMAALKRLMEKSGLREVVTYLNSGNVVFQADGMRPSAIREKLEKLIREKFGFPVVTLVLPLPELQKILDACPYAERSLVGDEKIYFTFLTGIPREDAVGKLKSCSDETDECTVAERVVYVLVRRGYVKTTYTNNFIEKTLGVGATTRNYDTVRKIVERGMRA